MKRSTALAPLSRDHHLALEAALRLRRASADDVTLATDRFAGFWRDAGAHHFEIEEALILPALPAADPEWQAAAARVRAEHAEIRARAESLAGSDVEGARRLGELLTAHVRFEERVLFAQLEAKLDAKRLSRLGAAVEAAEAARA